MTINAVRIHPADDVVVLLHPVGLGEPIVFGTENAITAAGPIAAGHKAAIRDLVSGAKVHKYGFPIGHATHAIRAGEWIHSHNLATSLSGLDTYQYTKAAHSLTFQDMDYFDGFLRANGSVGIRNEIWILPMVSCVNHTARLIAEQCRGFNDGVDGVFALENPFGCSQLGEDHESTVTILRDIASHPNTGGVLLLSLGCENNTMTEFLAGLSDEVRQRVRFLVAQDHEDEIAAGLLEVKALIVGAAGDRRTRQPLSTLRVGFKCGASDGFSGLTANPLAGRVCERLVAHGAATVLTEVSEMFGAETILMERARDEATFDAIVDMIQGFKQYYIDNGQPVYEKPVARKPGGWHHHCRGKVDRLHPEGWICPGGGRAGIRRTGSPAGPLAPDRPGQRPGLDYRHGCGRLPDDHLHHRPRQPPGQLCSDRQGRVQRPPGQP